jgi:hypothetical protein
MHFQARIKQVHKAHTPGRRDTSFIRRPDPQSRRQTSITSQDHRLRQNLQHDIPALIGTSNGPDPFVRFPASTSLLDQRLFQFLMVYASPLVFGGQQEAGFDYLRDVTMPGYLSGYELMSWIALSAARVWNTLLPQFSDDWFLARRAANYRSLRQMLDKKPCQESDYMISCLVTAGYIENADDRTSAGLLHMKAALELIKQRNEGLRCLQTMQPIHAVNVLTTSGIAGLPIIFNTLMPLEHALSDVMENLRILQAWNKVIRYDRNYWDLHQQSSNQSWSLDNLIKDTASFTGKSGYCAMRHQSLDVKPLLDYLGETDLLEGQDYEWRSRLMTLYLLNSILKNLARDETVAIRFLQNLETMITSTIDVAASRVLYPFIPIICICTQRLGIWFYNGPENPLPPIRVWEAILFAEVMMLASHEIRQRMMRAMLHWLYDGAETLHDAATFDEAELRSFSDNILGNWEVKSSLG